MSSERPDAILPATSLPSAVFFSSTTTNTITITFFSYFCLSPFAFFIFFPSTIHRVSFFSTNTITNTNTFFFYPPSS